jgi:hypothetical protein
MAVVNLDTAARLDIICRRGDSFSLEVEFDQSLADVAASGSTGADGATGYDDVWTMNVKTAVDGTLVAGGSGFTVAPKSQDSSNADSKKLNITSTSSNMSLMPAGLYVYDIQQSTGPQAGATGDIIPGVTTYLFGTFEVREDVTDNA